MRPQSPLASLSTIIGNFIPTNRAEIKEDLLFPGQLAPALLFIFKKLRMGNENGACAEGE